MLFYSLLVVHLCSFYLLRENLISIEYSSMAYRSPFTIVFLNLAYFHFYYYQPGHDGSIVGVLLVGVPGVFRDNG